MTEPEVLLWNRLRLRDGSGLVFRRQCPAGPYILDFYCAKARLAIECDGYIHGDHEQAVHDLQRDRWLASKNFEVYRVPAADIYRDADAAADGVRLLANERRGLRRKQETPPPPR